MILLCNGDSWTQGDNPAQTLNWEADKTEDWYDIVPNFGAVGLKHPKRLIYKFYDSPVWPKILGKKLNVETWNAGRTGSDNRSIVKRTIQSVEWLIQLGKKDIFVVIGWSSPGRIPMFFKKTNGKLYLEQVRPYQLMDLTRETFEHILEIEVEHYLNILTLQQYLNSKKLNYLFFNAFDCIKNPTENFYSPLIDKTKWVNCSFTHNHFLDYIVQKYNTKGWDDSEYFLTSHPKDISHIEWGKFLFNYIKTL